MQTHICWLDALVVVQCHNLIKVDQQNLFITIVMECVITTEYQQQSLIKSPNSSILRRRMIYPTRGRRNNSIKHYLIKWFHIQRAFIMVTLISDEKTIIIKRHLTQFG